MKARNPTPDPSLEGYRLNSRRGLDRSADFQSVVFGTQNARGVLPLSPCEERAGREPERGETEEKHLLSPALSSFFEEERERKRGCALKANLLPNTTNFQSAVSPNSIRQSVGLVRRGGVSERLAECNSAIQQSATLRYEGAPDR